MAVRIIWSPSARLDLHDLKEYISLDSPEIAKRFVASLFDAIERLEVFPQSGRTVPEFEDEHLREIIRNPCRIVYRLNSDHSSIEIIRIWHAARGTPGIE